jgi:dTDP-4-dehydrorhamnose 3,5-epimerase
MFKDDRGWGLYNIFPDMIQGQVNVSTTFPGIIRAFHRHHNQADNWKVISGQFKVRLAKPLGMMTPGVSMRELYLDKNDDVLVIPPRVWHGFKVVGTEPGVLLYYVTNKYDPDNPDEERAPWNSFWEDGWDTEFK